MYTFTCIIIRKREVLMFCYMSQEKFRTNINIVLLQLKNHELVNRYNAIQQYLSKRISKICFFFIWPLYIAVLHTNCFFHYCTRTYKGYQKVRKLVPYNRWSSYAFKILHVVMYMEYCSTYKSCDYRSVSELVAV